MLAPSDHALFSPSSASRWLVCPASISMEAQIPRRTSKYADEGTLAHEIAARILTKQPLPADVDLDMLNYVRAYTDAVERQCAPADVLLVETRVDFSNILKAPDSFGTADAIIVKHDTVQLHDLKFGMGVEVNANRNAQLTLYAFGVLDLLELLDYNTAENFEFHIHQPRLDHYSVYRTSVAELKARIPEYQDAISKALSPEPTFNPTTEGCRFCRAFAVCRAAQQKAMKTLAEEFACLD